MADLDLFVIDVFMDFDFEFEAESFLLISFKVAFKLLANSVDPKEPLSKGHLKVIFFDAWEGNVDVKALFVGASFKNWSFGWDWSFHGLIFLNFELANFDFANVWLLIDELFKTEIENAVFKFGVDAVWVDVFG